MLLVPASVRGPAGRDTSGDFVLDTGAGYLSLDSDLAVHLGLANSLPDSGEIAFSERPVSRLVLGDLELDQVQPVLLFDGDIVRQVTDRQVLGLIGHQVLAGMALRFRFPQHEIEIIPVDGGPGSASAEGGPQSKEERERAISNSRSALEGRLTADAKPVTFMLAGDGKILLRVRVPSSADTLILILDTGASKSVLFRSSLERAHVNSARWPAARDLVAPTLFGPASADLVRLPELKVIGDRGPITTREIDAVIVDSELEDLLARATGQSIDGLLGYSFLRRFEVILDYPHRVLWLTPIPHVKDEREYEHSHVGLQLERREQKLTVIAVARDSPADQAGIRPADVLLAIDDRPTEALKLAEANHTLEGPAGTPVRVTVARGDVTLTWRLVRKRLL